MVAGWSGSEFCRPRLCVFTLTTWQWLNFVSHSLGTFGISWLFSYKSCFSNVWNLIRISVNWLQEKSDFLSALVWSVSCLWSVSSRTLKPAHWVTVDSVNPLLCAAEPRESRGEGERRPGRCEERSSRVSPDGKWNCHKEKRLVSEIRVGLCVCDFSVIISCQWWFHCGCNWTAHLTMYCSDILPRPLCLIF